MLRQHTTAQQAICRGAPPVSILVVDDNADVRGLLCALLELEGYITIAAQDGAEALELLAGIPPPAVILLDFMMPDMDGLDVVAALRADPELASIPVVFVSASPEMISTDLRVVSKPIIPEVLLRVVQECHGATAPVALPDH